MFSCLQQKETVEAYQTNQARTYGRPNFIRLKQERFGGRVEIDADAPSLKSHHCKSSNFSDTHVDHLKRQFHARKKRSKLHQCTQCEYSVTKAVELKKTC